MALVIHKPELHASGFRAILEVGNERLGKAAMEQLLTQLGTSSRDLDDPNAWFSLELAETLFDELLLRTKDPALIDRIMKLALSREHLGILYPLFGSFGTPAILYGQLARLLPRMNKVSVMRTELLGPRHIRVTARRAEGAVPERRPHFCRARQVQLSEAARMFDLPAAEVVHTECMLRGGEACVYDVRWSEHRRPVLSWIGLFGGAGIGFAMMHGAQPLAMMGVMLALALGGWAFGRSYELRRDLRNRLDDLEATQQALSRSTDAHEQRYRELLEAKTAVEEKVAERTADLSLATKQLSQTLAQVQELDKAKTDFFANVSHDLRTPLTLILGPLGEMASGREPPGGLAHSVDVMKRNGERLLNLINQLLDLAKIDSGKMQVARVPTDVAELARSVETRFSTAAAQRGLALTLEANLLNAMPLDSAWIENALTNLLANALRFAKSKVIVRAREESGSVVLEVEDDGPGIAAEDVANVFDRFAQGSDVQARKGGTGLGLAIVREAARLHGGEASVVSEPGIATTFRLTLPRTETEARTRKVTPDFVPQLPSPVDATRPAASAAGAAQASGLTTSSAFPASSNPPDKLIWDGPSPSSPLVVVVEDDDDLRGFTSAVLATSYRVHAARNGEEGFELIKRVRPEAVVSDVVMPKVDGYELCKRLRTDAQTRSLPVILLTARRDVGRVLEGFDAGADDYVTKPFHARELLARLNVHVGLRRMVSEMAHRERLASLGVLAASLAHQIRNPLNAILAGLPAVHKKLSAAMGPRDHEIFGAMIYSGERINQLVADLMDLSRVDSEAVARYRPADGVQACLRLIEAREGSQVHIDAEIDESIVLEGRPGDMNHVFLNLIDNAVRAADAGGRVRVRAQRRNGTFAFEVGDSGPGIAADKTEQVFAPFFTTRAAGEGTGLGLAIARQVVLQHGGTISVGRSDLGGALFTVALPAPVTLAPPS